VCVSVCVRLRMSESVSACGREGVCVSEKDSVCVCVREREKGYCCVCVSVCISA
jgi:hypothetical protein